MKKNTISIKIDQITEDLIEEEAFRRDISKSKVINERLRESYDYKHICKCELLPYFHDLQIVIDRINLENPKIASKLNREMKKIWMNLL